MSTITRRKSNLSAYERIERDLRNQIVAGRWTIGAMLPSRRDLARSYSVSPLTVERAVGLLIADGTLRADDRRGTFVASIPAQKVSRAKSHEQVVDTETRVPARGNPKRSYNGSDHSAKIGVVGIIVSVYRVDSQEYLILHALENALSEHGNATSVVNRYLGEGLPLMPLEEAVQTLHQQDVAAIAVVCLDLDRTQIESALDDLDIRSTPVVCIAAAELDTQVPHVYYENRSSGYQVAQHILDRGHAEITLVAPFTSTWVSERIGGVRAAISQAKLPQDILTVYTDESRTWIVQEDPEMLGYEITVKALDSGWRPTGGVICANDGVAFGVLKALGAAHLKAGRDFAIIGFDDDPLSRTIGLSTLRPPLEAMAREAARLLEEHMQGLSFSLQVRLRAHVITRASTNFHPVFGRVKSAVL